MKTLHNIFHYRLFINYGKVLFGTIAALIVGLSTLKTESGGFLALLGPLSLIVAFLGPLSTLFINNTFPHNVKFLINQHFNRSELLKFFFFSRTLKVVLTAMNYGFLFVAVLLFSNSSVILDKLGIPEFTFSYLDFFLAFALGFSAIYLLYFASLFSANMEELRRTNISNIAKQSRKRDIKGKVPYFILLAGLSLYLSGSASVPAVLIGYAWSFFVVAKSISILNRTFKLTHQKKSPLLACAGGFVLCVPLLGAIYGMRIEVQDPTLSFKEKTPSALYLGSLNPDFSKEQMLGFLKEAPDLDYYKTLMLFGNKVAFDSSLPLANNAIRAKGFIEFYSRKLPEEKVKKIVAHMADLIDDGELKPDFAYSSWRFFQEQKVDEEYIDELLISDNTYKKLAAIHFARNSLSTEKLQVFYKDNKSSIDKVGDERWFTRGRTVAGQNDSE